jgi:hypothetical protein
MRNSEVVWVDRDKRDEISTLPIDVLRPPGSQRRVALV